MKYRLFLLPLWMLLMGFQSHASDSISQTELQQEADAWHADFQQPSEGISLGVIEGLERIYASAGKMRKEGALVDQNTLFEIGSITKVFTGILLADAVLEGQVALEDSIGKHLPQGVLSDDSPLHNVTLLQLSTHTSGLPRLPGDLSEGAKKWEPYAHYTRERLMNYLGSFGEEDFEKPGEYAYSNLGVGLLGEILAMINDTEYEILLSERILKPLGMSSTWVQKNEASEPEHLKKYFADGHRGGDHAIHWRLNAFSGAGAMVSSVSDMLNFAEAHWSNETPEYLKSALTFAMEQHTERVGLGWHFDGDALTHGGGTGGFGTSLKVDVAHQSAKVNLRNSSGEKVEVDRTGEFSEIVGFWSGALDLGASQLRLVMHVTADGDAYHYSIDQGGMPIPNSKAVFDNGELSVSYPTIGGVYKAKFENGELIGTWAQGRELPLNLVRSHNMPEPLAKVFDRVYKGDLEPLEGFWRGKIGDGDEGLFVYLEIREIEDRYQALIWSPTQSPLPIGVTKVKFNKNKLMVESKMINGAFEGKLKPERNQIDGIWTQGAESEITLLWSSERPKE